EVVGPLRVPGESDRDRLDEVALEAEADRVLHRRLDVGGAQCARLALGAEIQITGAVGAAPGEEIAEEESGPAAVAVQEESGPAAVAVQEVARLELARVDEASISAADDRLAI